MRKLRISAFLLFLLLIKTLSCDAQTTLQFPKSLSVQELSTTGIALVNTSSTSATAVFNLYGNDGSLVTSTTVIELAQKIHKRQFEIPKRFGSNPATIWRQMLFA